MIALVGVLVGLRAGYRYDRSIGRQPLRPGAKRLAFRAALFGVEWLVVPPTLVFVGPLVGLLVFGYVLAVAPAGPWVAEYYRRRAPAWTQSSCVVGRSPVVALT